MKRYIDRTFAAEAHSAVTSGWLSISSLVVRLATRCFYECRFTRLQSYIGFRYSLGYNYKYLPYMMLGMTHGHGFSHTAIDLLIIFIMFLIIFIHLFILV